MLQKIQDLLSPIFQDLEVTILWIATAAAVFFLISAIMKYYQSSDENERKIHVKWMRIIVIGYIALHLVTWLVKDYLSPKLGGGGAATTLIEMIWSSNAFL
ncbi:hypothetical protein D3C74_91080 [compost metagenome]